MSYDINGQEGMFFDEENEEESTLPSNPEDMVTNQKYFPSNDTLLTSPILTRDFNIDAVMHNIGGYKLELTYFLQDIDPNDPIGAPDPSVGTTVRQYRRIDKLIVHMQNTVDMGTSNEFEFEAVIDAGISPSIGDAALLLTPHGREAILDITEARLSHYNNREVHVVKFKLKTFVDVDRSYYDDLIIKTHIEEVYDKNFVTEQSSPVITKKDYIRKISLREEIPNIVEHYLKYFLHSRARVLALPNESEVYADTMLNEFIFKVINVTDNPDLLKVTKLNFDTSDTIKYSLWDILLKRDINMLKKLQYNIGFKYTPYNVNNPITRDIFFLNINYIVDTLENNISPVNPNIKEISIDTDYVRKVTKKDNDDYSYIFSKNFYKQEMDKLSLIEGMTLNYIKCVKNDIKSLDILIEEYPYWTSIEQYYYLPILILLIKDAIINSFSRY